MEKYGTLQQATDDNIIRRMRLELWINKAGDRRWEFSKFLAFPHQNFSNAPSCYVDLYIDWLCSVSCYYYHHHSAVSLTCSQSLPGRVLCRVRSIACIFMYVLLYVYVCLIVCFCTATLTEVFPCFSSVVWQMPG